MSTDYKFRAYLKEYLRVESNTYSHGTLLMAISSAELSDDILILIKQFLESLSIEEAREYVNMPDAYNYSILFFANVNMLKIIMKYISDVNVKNTWGNTALARECIVIKPQLKNIDKIKFLLDNGFDVNIVNCDNETALMHFCSSVSRFQSEDFQTILEQFIHCGADVQIKSIFGRTAFDHVKDASTLSERSSQLLRGLIRMNRTKKATSS